MTSVWTEADLLARRAIEAELHRRQAFTPEALREALRAVGQAASVKALALLGRDHAGTELASFVKGALRA
jgi:hypothetical protein